MGGTRRPVRSDKAAQLLPIDADGDGDADVVTARDAHGYGLDWWENPAVGGSGDGGGDWVRHEIMGNPGANAAPVLFTQPHALAAADVNGDGLTDFVTGKRFFAHGPDGDPRPPSATRCCIGGNWPAAPTAKAGPTRTSSRT